MFLTLINVTYFQNYFLNLDLHASMFFIKYCLPSKFVFLKDCLPLKVVFNNLVISIKGSLKKILILAPIKANVCNNTVGLIFFQIALIRSGMLCTLSRQRLLRDSFKLWISLYFNSFTNTSVFCFCQENWIIKTYLLFFRRNKTEHCWGSRSPQHQFIQYWLEGRSYFELAAKANLGLLNVKVKNKVKVKTTKKFWNSRILSVLENY